jgi:hypothetical protein
MAGFDLAQFGYILEEFFLEGAATSYEPAGPAGADGYWEVTPSGQAPFATRLVYAGRPIPPRSPARWSWSGSTSARGSTRPRTGC